MKKLISSAAIALGLAVAAHAGTAGKQIVVQAPVDYGTGAYIGLEGGINALQETAPGNNSKIGGVGGLKAGYVIGNGVFRPTLEADLFYNGFSQPLQVGKLDVNSGAFMGNVLFRFALGQIQPYIGGGIGGYIADGNSAFGVSGGRAPSTMGSGVLNGSTNGFAWQVIGGVDYYFTPTLSVFSEYKFLNYNNSLIIHGDDFGQHLVVLGVRMHF